MFKLFNTLTKKKEAFEPIHIGLAKIYHCGPTVYDRAHIGNLRAYVFADVLRRSLEYKGYKVTQVINITDVGHLSGDNAGDADLGEDKMTKAVKREGLPMTIDAMREVGTKFFELFKKDLERLNILSPHHFPRASDYIKENIDIISKLEEKGYIYKTDDGIYFDTSKFPMYGILIGKKKKPIAKDTLSRITENLQKKSLEDFALWKFNNNLGWDSPWGKGFPGWHIECSSMSRALLGQPFDIHTGGQEHKAIHHTNEIAQSEAAYGTSLANYWMHNAWLIFQGGKMAKSLGNIITLDDLIEEMISPLAYRYWLLTAKYRSPIDFSLEALQASQTALIRLITTLTEFPDNGKISEKHLENYSEFIDDDIDTPKMVAYISTILKDKKTSDADKKATIIDMDRILGLNLINVPKPEKVNIPPEIVALAEMRSEARKSKEWKKADAFRVEIESRGYSIKDTDSGYEILPA